MSKDHYTLSRKTFETSIFTMRCNEPTPSIYSPSGWSGAILTYLALKNRFSYKTLNNHILSVLSVRDVNGK